MNKSPQQLWRVFVVLEIDRQRLIVFIMKASVSLIPSLPPFDPPCLCLHIYTSMSFFGDRVSCSSGWPELDI